MKTRLNIQPEPLTKEAFLPFGEVLETNGISPQLINFGNTHKYGKLAEISIIDNAVPQISIYRSRAIELPFRIQLLERHPLGSQAFYPLHQQPFPVIVAAADGSPGIEAIRVFITNGRQGVNLHAGVWHHYQLTLGQDSEYLVIDRGGEGENYQEHRFSEDLWLDL
jgi:ureidoglycolate lyase